MRSHPACILDYARDYAWRPYLPLGTMRGTMRGHPRCRSMCGGMRGLPRENALLAVLGVTKKTGKYCSRHVKINIFCTPGSPRSDL